MDLLKYGIGIDMAMENFDVCLSVIDLKQQVVIKSRSSFSNSCPCRCSTAAMRLLRLMTNNAA